MNETRRIARLFEIREAALKAKKRPSLRRKAAKRAYNSARRARIKGQLCTCCSPADIRAVFCAAALLLSEVDHRIPLALGGLHCLRNLQILPEAVHKVKTAKDVRLISQVRGGTLSLLVAIQYIEGRH